MTDGGEHGNGKLSTEVLTEFFEAIEQFVRPPQGRMIAE